MATALRSRWIGGRAFDLVWFFGGALASLAAFALVFAFRPSIVVVAWIWLLLFDGPHMMALYTRTYLEREAWRTRRRLLLGALAVFLAPVACLAAAIASGSDAPFLAFLGVASVYSYHHVVRQHYGFCALYRARSGEAVTPRTYRLDKAALYLGLWIPWVHFLVAHPVGRVLRGAAAEASASTEAVGFVLVASWALVLVLYAALRVRTGGLAAIYLLVVAAVHGFLYFVASRLEPALAHARTPDQQILLMTVMGGIFHSAQYLGIVWLYHARSRGPCSGAGASGQSVQDAQTSAPAFGGSIARYLGICVAFSAVYVVFAALTSVYPAITLLEEARIGSVQVSRLALCLWWGIALHHYVIDERIWRLRTDEALRSTLAGA